VNATWITKELEKLPHRRGVPSCLLPSWAELGLTHCFVSVSYRLISLTLREDHRLRVFENRVLRIFGPKREKEGSWRKLHNDELRSLYSSTSRVIKSRKMRRTGHVARMGKGKGGVFTGFWLGGRKGRDHREDLGLGRRVTLTWALGKLGSMGRTGFGWLGIGSSGGLLWTR
jgi:hypothetical protein